jgi:hypothetical protein
MTCFFMKILSVQNQNRYKKYNPAKSYFQAIKSKTFRTDSHISQTYTSSIQIYFNFPINQRIFNVENVFTKSRKR